MERPIYDKAILTANDEHPGKIWQKETAVARDFL